MADFTIADVLAWARTKPADQAYNYGSTENCAVCQFLRETGRCKTPAAGGDYWRNYKTGFRDKQPLPDGLEFALQEHTFGGLVARLEAVCPQTVIAPSDWSRLDAYLTDIDAVSADKLAPALIQPHTV